MRNLILVGLSLLSMIFCISCQSEKRDFNKVEYNLKAAYYNLEKYELLPGITLIIEINNKCDEQVKIDFNKATGVQKNKFIFASKEKTRVAENYGGNEILMAPGFHWMLPFNVPTVSEHNTLTNNFSYKVNVDSISNVYNQIVSASKLYLLTLNSDKKAYDTLEIKRANDFQIYNGTFSQPQEMK